MDELAADYTQFFLMDTEMFRRFVEKNARQRSWGRKLIDGLKKVLGLVKQKAAIPQEYREALSLWEKAYREEAAEAAKKAPVQESTGAGAVKYSLDNYSTDGVHWIYQIDGIDNRDARFVWEVITNINKRGYRGYTKTAKGEYIADNGNKMFFINANFENPYVIKVIIFADRYETNMYEAKELIRDANTQGNAPRHREALRVIRDAQGEWYVSEYVRQDYRANARQVRGREGANRSGTSGEGQTGRNSSGIKRSVSGTENILDAHR